MEMKCLGLESSETSMFVQLRYNPSEMLRGWTGGHADLPCYGGCHSSFAGPLYDSEAPCSVCGFDSASLP